MIGPSPSPGGSAGAATSGRAGAADPADAPAAGWPGRLWRRFGAGRPLVPERAAAREVFRLGAPVVIWWVWLAFAAANLVDLGLEAAPRFAIVVSAILVTITGVAYACAFRARVVADETGITVLNPVREYRAPWGAVQQIDVRDWVRFRCATAAGADTAKVVESWALFATARVKRNYSQRAQAYAARSADSARMPEEAKRLMTLPMVVIIARRLDQRVRSEQASGAPAGALTASWAWPSIAAMLLPAVALVIVLLG